MSKKQWQKEGLEHIWLPYTQMKDFPIPLPVESANGVDIKLEDGRSLIDGISSWWSVCHGYQHPYIINNMEKQLKKLSHIMFAGLSHEPAYILSERLAKITPNGLNRVFFSDSGSTAIEVALKMAVQFWANNNRPKKNKFICFRNAYHGDTMGAMSIADNEDGMHKAFHNFMPKQYMLKIPSDEYDFAEFNDVIKDIKHTVAGLVIEPLIQGAGGMKFHGADILAEIHRICKKNDILFIADEIATGFCRTGAMFACNEAAITPDIMCLGKALTGGYITLAATIATDEIFNTFLSDNLSTALMHGPTFMANPLACSAANASLDLFEKEPRLEQVGNIEEQMIEELSKCKKLENISDVRVKGAVGAVQLENYSWDYIFGLRKKFIEDGVWIRPFGDIVYLMPAFVISQRELSTLTGSVYKIIKNNPY